MFIGFTPGIQLYSANFADKDILYRYMESGK